MKSCIRVTVAEWVSFFYPLVDNSYRKGPAAQCFLPKIDTIPLSTTHCSSLAILRRQRVFFSYPDGSSSSDGGKHEGKSVHVCVFVKGKELEDGGQADICKNTACQDDCGASSPFFLFLFFSLSQALTFLCCLPTLCLSYVLSHSVTSSSSSLCLSVSFYFFFPSQIRPAELQAAGLVNWNGRVSRPGQWALCFLPKHL